tara:strand:- start:46862 stop:48310 length:1449 start_codon:yes stop_codon:yes gene_type:complete
MFSSVHQLRAHAEDDSEGVALAAIDRQWTFAELDVAVSAVATRLREEGIRPRQLVAIDLEPALDWIVTLALFRLAARSLSLSGLVEPIALGADVLITDPARMLATAALTVTIDRLWLDDAVSEYHDRGEPGPPAVHFPRPDSTCRLILTSGTTGEPRAAMLSVAAVEHRLSNLDSYWTDGRVELNLMTLSTTGGFHTALAALRHGVPYLAMNQIDLRTLRAAAAMSIAVLAGSPVQVGHALGLLREHAITLPTLREIRTAGAAPTPGFVAAATREHGVPIKSVYGSTEGGGISMTLLAEGDDPSDTGALLPGIDLEIVDADGIGVATGNSGEVRYRGPGLASGYLNEGSGSSFRAGWFHPGDRGMLNASGHLVLDGRDSELINLGGVKIDPASVDAVIEGFPGVTDAAAFVIERRAGVPELGLAVVAEANGDLRALDRMLRQRMPGKHPTVFGRVATIPRNRMGKVERRRLTDEFRRRLSLD